MKILQQKRYEVSASAEKLAYLCVEKSQCPSSSFAFSRQWLFCVQRSAGKQLVFLQSVGTEDFQAIAWNASCLPWLSSFLEFLAIFRSTRRWCQDIGGVVIPSLVWQRGWDCCSETCNHFPNVLTSLRCTPKYCERHQEAAQLQKVACVPHYSPIVFPPSTPASHQLLTWKNANFWTQASCCLLNSAQRS